MYFSQPNLILLHRFMPPLESLLTAFWPMLSYMLLLFHHYFLLFRHYFLLFHHCFLDFYTTFWIDPTPKFNEHRLNACPRHGDLCHLSPQLLKKKFAFLCILPRKRHRAVSEPGTFRFKDGHSTDVLSEPLTKCSISSIIIYVTYKSSASYRYWNDLHDLHGPLGPPNLEARVLLSELSSLMMEVEALSRYI